MFCGGKAEFIISITPVSNDQQETFETVSIDTFCLIGFNQPWSSVVYKVKKWIANQHRLLYWRIPSTDPKFWINFIPSTYRCPIDSLSFLTAIFRSSSDSSSTNASPLGLPSLVYVKLMAVPLLAILQPENKSINFVLTSEQ